MEETGGYINIVITETISQDLPGLLTELAAPGLTHIGLSDEGRSG